MTVKASIQIGQASLTLICHDESTQDNDRVFKSFGQEVCNEYVPVGKLKCPWYEFTITNLSS